MKPRAEFEIEREVGDALNGRHAEVAGVVGAEDRVEATGRPSAATPEYRRALREVVQTPPQSLGYGFSVWSVARLGEHLKKLTGIRFSDDQLRRILHQEGFSFQRPKHTMKGKRDEIAYQRAQRQLVALKKKHSKTMPTPS